MATMQQGKRQSIGKNMLFNSVGSLFYLMCQWLVTVLSTRLGSFETCGVLTLAISITNVFYVVSTFSLRVFQVSDTNGKYPPGRYYSTRLMTGMLGFAGCVLFTLANAQYSLMQALCIVVYMLFKLGEALVDTLAAEQQKAWRMDYTCYSFLMRGIAMLGTFVAAMLLWHSLLIALVLMAVATLAIVLLYDLHLTLKLAPGKFDLSLKKSLPLLKEAWPMMLNGMLMTMLASIPRYFLEQFAGSETLGVYSSIAMPAVIIQTGCSFIYSPLVAPLSEKYHAGDRAGFGRGILRALLAVLAMAAAVMLGGVLLGDWGLCLLYGEAIAPYTGQLLMVLVATLCMALLYFFEVPLTIVRRLKMMSVMHLVAAVLVTLLSVMLIPSMGMVGVNVAIIAAAGLDVVCMGAATLWLTRKSA